MTVLTRELRNANNHIAFLTSLTGETLKTFGKNFLSPEDEKIEGSAVSLDSVPKITHSFLQDSNLPKPEILEKRS